MVKIGFFPSTLSNDSLSELHVKYFSQTSVRL